MIKEKEITINVPETLYDVNLAGYLVFKKIMNIENLSDFDRAAHIIAEMNDLDIEEVRAMPMKDIDSIAAKIINLFYKDDGNYNLDNIRNIKVEDQLFGLEPNFDAIETGAYIDITSHMEDIENSIHKLMAVLYRPILNSKGDKYTLTAYSTEDDYILKEREELFLRSMPYAVVRAVVNFMSSHIAN